MNFSIGSFSLQPKKQTAAAPLKLHYNEPDAVEQLCHWLRIVIDNIPAYQKLAIVCIGTDRSTGDALGPLVGSAIQKSNVNVPIFGTLDEPVHAVNLSEQLRKITELYHNPYIIAVDACLGQISSVGSIQAGYGPVKPGAGVNKDLPPVGHSHITGVVNVGGFMEYFVLQNTRLSLVVNMANVIADSFRLALTDRFADFTSYSSLEQ